MVVIFSADRKNNGSLPCPQALLPVLTPALVFFQSWATSVPPHLPCDPYPFFIIRKVAMDPYPVPFLSSIPRSALVKTTWAAMVMKSMHAGENAGET
jgi:hypothetical protein